ncbi:O-antigen ligase family protein [Brenneria izbisi]|uniref:O-antigen ligase-related domain-containing protein n=1 Tax=Brenneria izbisi TaxID=2939450 RepID=A0AA41XWZ7_9GAMM|nr:O-antigen ligase family protein [Brenneria izbisi]MCV9878012.1 hypothetical protein [Brenneria izbisi]MCV9881424.1 hypothetical protein [Brenneria izbisi]
MKEIEHRGMIRIIYLSIILFAFTSIFSLISVKTDNQLMKLWKEILIIIFYGISIFFLLKRRFFLKKQLFIAVFLPFGVVFLYLITSLDDNFVLVLYQLKNDIIPFLFIFGVFCFIYTQSASEVFYERICKIFIVLGSINFIAIIIQRIFTSWFLIALQIDDLNNQSGKSGLRLDNTSDGLRAMGTMTSFINSGTLMILSLFILMESGVFRKKTKIILAPIFIFGAIATTYKTAIITLLLYIPLKLLLVFIRSQFLKKIIIFIYTIICFTVMAFLFNSNYLYDRLKDTSLRDAVYSSVYIRVLQHDDILNDVYNHSPLTGVGVGVHGTQGPPQLKYNSKALDSTYVNILSNYGILGLIVYILIFVVIFMKIVMYDGLGGLLTSFILFFHLGVEFFANNLLMNFPLNVYFSIFIFISLFFKERQLTKSC